ncbi:MAG: hypothetical protein B6D64_08545 [Bacteroidetes bacterium 4484_276]|nr:MAG: hypothetical protein B6D64_08545 [Bacteroidetes bacterium 4484_276]
MMKKKPVPTRTRKQLILGIVSIIILLAFVFLFVFRKIPSSEFQSKTKKQSVEVKKTDFTIEGKLTFTSNAGDSLVTIAIEIADDDYSRQMGLMYRYYIPDTVGMLFIFPDETQRSFWMKNTPSSLDIIYANKQKEIVRVWENTFPYSEKSIPSGDKAKYVIEVGAGFCSRHGISTNNKFEYIQY